ncbi:hypothetical protein SAMN02745119_03298 [Trichlorobacter thiogenes]|uniref:Uncharacterized protein n=1 Tax=Trichlorobacter thiogenes TaxID=115783 RepID=A0A1T4S6S4_9BACT|nr:hypothetical protein [Trichlorobacter thiogenes]SKA23935.1 hypothetical protein SAMN02745119_03298 [Trichlorobacter thiogenes]
MKRVALFTCMMLLFSVIAFAAGPDKSAFDKWAKAVKLSGYSYGGVDQTDPGVYMAGWMSSKGDVLGVHLHPATSFKSFQQVVNKKKPESFTYKGMPAVYSDGTGFGSIAIKYEKSGKVISISQMGQAAQAKGLSKAELTKLLDVMKPELFLK